MSDATQDALATEVRARLTALETNVGQRVDDRLAEATSGEKLKQLVIENLPDLLQDKEFARKLTFAQPAPELVGTKYARLGMNAGDVEMLYDILQAGREAGMSRGPSEELTRTFEAISAGRYMTTALARAEDERHLADMRRAGRLDVAGYERALRAMDTAETGFGLQLIGAQYVGELWEAARRESRVFNLLDTFEMTEATAYLPVEVDIPEMLFVAENTSGTASDYSTVKTGSQRVQVSPSKFIIHQVYSGEMEEDSIIPWLPFLRRQAGLSLAHYSDSNVLNGDTTNAGTGNINLDDADPADTKAYLAFDGMRHAALVDNTANGSDVAGAITLAKLNALRGLMLDTSRFVDWGHPTMPEDQLEDATRALGRDRSGIEA